MLLTEIEQKIKPLSSTEKIRLIRFIADDLEQEQAAEQAELAQYFKPGDMHGFWGVHDSCAAAAQLQTLLEKPAV